MPCVMLRSDERTCEFLRASGSREIVKASRGAFIIKDATSSKEKGRKKLIFVAWEIFSHAERKLRIWKTITNGL